MLVGLGLGCGEPLVDLGTRSRDMARDLVPLFDLVELLLCGIRH